MPYATHADLNVRFGAAQILRLADRDRDGAPDATVLDQALASAGAVVEGYLATRYRLPLAATPDLVRDLVLDLAFTRLHVGGQVPEDVREREKRTFAVLRDVADGKVSLPLPADAGSGEPAAATGGAAVAAPERVFSRETLAGW